MSILGPSFAKQVLKSKTLSRWVKPMAESYAKLAGYRRVGLKYDDLLIEENEPVQRALQRLTPQQQYDRAYRIRVATNQSMLHHDLPKDQWVSAKDDVRYLAPLVEDVINEDAERNEWDGAIIEKRSKKAAH